MVDNDDIIAYVFDKAVGSELVVIGRKTNPL